MLSLVSVLALVPVCVLLPLLLPLQESKRFRDSDGLEEEQGDGKRSRLADPGDCYDADTEDSDED